MIVEYGRKINLRQAFDFDAESMSILKIENKNIINSLKNMKQKYSAVLKKYMNNNKGKLFAHEDRQKIEFLVAKLQIYTDLISFMQFENEPQIIEYKRIINQ